MVRSFVSGAGLLAMIAAVVVGAYYMVQNFSVEMDGTGGAGGGSGPLVVRVSGDPGVAFDGDYTTATGTETFNGTLQTTPMDFEIPEESIAGVSVVTVNVRRRGTTGSLEATLVQNGRVLQSQKTDAATTSVSLTYSP